MTVEIMASEVHLEHPGQFIDVSDTSKEIPQLCQAKVSGTKRGSLNFYNDSNPKKKSKFIIDDSSIGVANCTLDDSELISTQSQCNPNVMETVEPNSGVNMLSGREQTISIHETYQLAYLDSNCDADDSGSLYIFDFVDGLEVTYPVSISNSESFAFDMPPLFVEPQYTDQLTALATEALNQLTQRINGWLSACQKADEKLLVWRHLRTYNSTIELRKTAFRLLSNLAPQVKRLTFDPYSPTLDKLFSKLVQTLHDKLSFKNVKRIPEKQKLDDPIVSLCPDADHCLNCLRDQIVQVLKYLLPNLSLPPSFDPEIDLIPLIETICGCNANSS